MTIMIVDSICMISSLNPVAEVDIPQRQREKRDRDCDKYQVLHVQLLKPVLISTLPVCGRTTRSLPQWPCSGALKEPFTRWSGSSVDSTNRADTRTSSQIIAVQVAEDPARRC